MKSLCTAVAAVLLLGSAAHAGTIVYTALLTGAAEVPPTGSTGTGSATVTIDTVAQTMQVLVTFSGLLGPTTASHIHCCTTTPFSGNAGVATTTPTFPGFPLGVTSGTYSNMFDLTSAATYNPAFVTAEGSVSSAEGALLAAMAVGETYLNIHSTVDPGGEIRGYLTSTATPEPGTLLMAGIALIGLAVRRRLGILK